MAEKKDTEPQAEDVATRDDEPQAEPQAEPQQAEPQAGGATTRDDANDLGVPMLAGSPDEPTGPEDALGEGPKRGDYTDRIGPSNYHPHEAKVVEGKTQLEAQRPRASEVGEVAGRKGGVDSAQG